MRFNELEYENEPVVKESIINWYEFPRQPVIKNISIKESKVVREDNLFMEIPGLTAVEQNFFHLEEGSTTSRTRKSSTRLAFRFSIDNDIIVIHRSVYNSLMLLGNLGGLFVILFALFTALLCLVKF